MQTQLTLAATRIKAPAKKVGAPAKGVEPPAKKVGAPAKGVEPPAKRVGAPAQGVEPPAKKILSSNELLKALLLCNQLATKNPSPYGKGFCLK